jgi:hypothetical protein
MKPRPAFARRNLIALLALGFIGCGLFSPGVNRVREAAARSQSSNNLHQMGIGISAMAETYAGKVPPCTGFFMGRNGTLFFQLLPFIEQDNYFKMVPIGGTSNNPGLFQNIAIKTYCAPLDESNDGKSSLISYTSNRSLFLPGGTVAGPVETGGARFPASFIQKGSMNQIVLAERFSKGAHRWWDNDRVENTSIDGAVCNAGTPTAPIAMQFDTAPAAANDSVAHALSSSAGLVGLADGSSKSVTREINTIYGAAPRTVFNWACAPLGEPVAPPQW